MIQGSRRGTHLRESLRENPPLAQLRRLFPTLLVVYMPAGLILGGMTLYAYAPGNRVETLTRDPLALVEAELLKFQLVPEKSIHTFALLHLPLYTGLVSDLGVLLWTAAAALSLFAWVQTWNQRDVTLRPGYLGALGSITVLLLADDLWMLHERVLAKFLPLPGVLLLTVYMIGFLLLCGYYVRDMLRSDYLLLCGALLCFGLSLAVDALPGTLPQQQLLEDGAKFAGILHWAGYQWQLARQQLQPRNG